MTRAEFAALRKRIRHEQGIPPEDYLAYDEEAQRRHRWHATYNAALTGLVGELKTDCVGFTSTLEVSVVEGKRICTAHADALHGSIAE